MSALNVRHELEFGDFKVRKSILATRSLALSLIHSQCPRTSVRLAQHRMVRFPQSGPVAARRL